MEFLAGYEDESNTPTLDNSQEEQDAKKSPHLSPPEAYRGRIDSLVSGSGSDGNPPHPSSPDHSDSMSSSDSSDDDVEDDKAAAGPTTVKSSGSSASSDSTSGSDSERSEASKKSEHKEPVSAATVSSKDKKTVLPKVGERERRRSPSHSSNNRRRRRSSDRRRRSRSKDRHHKSSRSERSKHSHRSRSRSRDRHGSSRNHPHSHSDSHRHHRRRDSHHRRRHRRSSEQDRDRDSHRHRKSSPSSSSRRRHRSRSTEHRRSHHRGGAEEKRKRSRSPLTVSSKAGGAGSSSSTSAGASSSSVASSSRPPPVYKVAGVKFNRGRGTSGNESFKDIMKGEYIQRLQKAEDSMMSGKALLETPSGPSQVTSSVATVSAGTGMLNAGGLNQLIVNQMQMHMQNKQNYLPGKPGCLTDQQKELNQKCILQSTGRTREQVEAQFGIKIPEIYNESTNNLVEFAERKLKREMLWKNKQNKAAINTTFNAVPVLPGQSQTDKDKFLRLMGFKKKSGEDLQTVEEVSKGEAEQEAMVNSQILNDNLEREYESSRRHTHFNRGCGLGYSTTLYQPH